jgi:hypothetical protein
MKVEGGCDEVGEVRIVWVIGSLRSGVVGAGDRESIKDDRA